MAVTDNTFGRILYLNCVLGFSFMIGGIAGGLTMATLAVIVECNKAR